MAVWEGAGFMCVGTVLAFLWTHGLQTERSGSPMGVAAPEVLQGLVNWAGWMRQGLRHLLSLPSHQVSQVGSGWPTGPRADRQAGRQGGEPSGIGRKESIVCRNPTKGPGPQCGGFFEEKQTGLSFHQLLLK